jgi:hypothetical protein
VSALHVIVATVVVIAAAGAVTGGLGIVVGEREYGPSTPLTSWQFRFRLILGVSVAVVVIATLAFGMTSPDFPKYLDNPL